jgi:hypothetical protein
VGQLGYGARRRVGHRDPLGALFSLIADSSKLADAPKNP